MKDSGVEWIGEVPDYWIMSRAKSVMMRTKIIAGSHHGEYQRLALTLNGVIRRSKEEADGLQPKDFDTYQILRNNELVFKLIDLENVRTSRVGLSAYTGIVSPAYIVCKTLPNTVPKYVFYYFYSMWLNQVFNYLGDDGVRSNLSVGDLLNVPFPIFDLSEQQRIADYLDERCGEIDEVKQTLSDEIEALQRLRKATIHKAVTKGLDESAPMKDSGVEWIGEIPEGWNRSKLLHGLSQPITDGPHETPVLYDEGIPFVSAEAVSAGKGKIDFSHIRGYISEDYYAECCRKYTPRKNDIYMIKSGATTGRVALVTGDEPIFTIWSPLAAIRCDEVLLHYNYCFYFMQSYCFQNQVQDAWTFGTQQNIGMRSIEQLMVCLPSLDEQRRIADYLDKRCGEIDSIIETRTKQLERLEDYRKALVFAYVTGKKEVSVHE